MKKKLRVGVLFGGRSAEHDVSLQSATNVSAAIDRSKYDVVLIGVDRRGEWHLRDAVGPFLFNAGAEDSALTLLPGAEVQEFVHGRGRSGSGPIDVVFPILHGPYGEDGTVQGFLKLANLPFVGAGVLGSAVGMDKDVMKRLLRDAGFPIAEFVVLRRSDERPAFAEIAHELGVPVFVKPANLGSSVGISKAADETELRAAVDTAFQYDHKVLIEAAVAGRELECAILGNETMRASVVGEIIPRHDFYSYEAKYFDENGAVLKIPADVDDRIAERVRDLAIRVAQTLSCEGMARVDFFLRDDGELVVNELNSIPGFTRISMFPRLWQASGLPYPDLIDTLIQLALERFDRDAKLR